MTTWEFRRFDDPVTYRATFDGGILEVEPDRLPMDDCHEDPEDVFSAARDRLDAHGILRTGCADEAAALRELRAFGAEL